MTESNSKVIVNATESKARNIKLTLNEVVLNFRATHGSKYDYSLFKYVKNSVKGKIICPEHGIFEQSYMTHYYSRSGCPKCKGRYKSIEDIIRIFIGVHRSRYDYSLIVPCKATEKLSIICRSHGLFQMSFHWHKKGRGCPKCGLVKQGRSSRKLNRDILIDAFRGKHGFDAYDYSGVAYKGVDEQVSIKCNSCKLIFYQTPYNHRSGQGCPVCNKSTPYTRSKYVEVCNRGGGLSNLYIVKLSHNGESFYKVGITRNSVEQRLSRIPYGFKIIELIRGEAGYIWDLEKRIQALLKGFHYTPKIAFGGSSLECYAKISENVYKLVTKIKQTKQLQLLT